MTTIIEKAINMAVQNLNAAGCRYFIIKPDGTELGDRTLLAPPEPKRHHKKVYKFAHLGYKATLEGMKAGDVKTFTPPEGVPVESYRKVITATASKVFGSGNYLTAIKDGTVEVMRTGGAP